MRELSHIFYHALRSEKDARAASFILANMGGDNTERGYAKKLRLIADELDKIVDELPF